MICKYCQEWMDKYPNRTADGAHIISMGITSSPIQSSPIQCAFSSGVFSTENCNCGVCSHLREFAEKNYPGWSAHDDLNAESIAVIPIGQAYDDETQRGYIVMTWYKNRGCGLW